MNTTRLCPQCQQPLSADAPDGLCPQCLMKAATGPAPSASGVGLPADIIDIGDPAEVAKKLPQFEILELLGRGGMGVVYKARQLQLDRIVALKILPPVDALTADFVARFTREARALAKLNHPNIVHVYDFGETGGLYYIIMEYVEGANLRQLLEARKLTPAEALAIVPKICDALEYAHEEGLVHRDIKPENLLIDKKGRVKIADFGLAKLLRREPLDMTLTLSGMALGTLRYMAPEQMDKPETVDHRADLYSLGVVIYEMLTGETPVGRFELPSQKAQVDVRFDEIVLHALEREPDRRYQHASEVRDDVEKVTSKTAVPASPQIPATSLMVTKSKSGSDAGRTFRRVWLALAFAALVFGVAHMGQIVFWTQVHTSYSSDATGRLVNPRAPDPAHRPNGRFLVLDLIAAAVAGLVLWSIGTRTQAARAIPVATPPSPASDEGKEKVSEVREPVVGESSGAKPPTRHLLSAFLVLLSLSAFIFGVNFRSKMEMTPAGRTSITTVGSFEPMFVRESGPSGFHQHLQFFSWSFFAVIVSGVSFAALWRVSREDEGKVARDPAWWRDWWKQVGVWGGLLLIVCIVRTVMDPAKVLQSPGDRTVGSRFKRLFSSSPEFREDPSRIPAARTPGRTDYAYAFTVPANHRIFVWLEWWKDGKRTIDQNFNTGYVAKPGQRYDAGVQLVFTDGNVAGPTTAGQKRIDWVFYDATGHADSGEWRPDFFAGMMTTVSWGEKSSWSPKAGETVTLLEIAGGKNSVVSGPLTDEHLRAGRWQAAMLLKARVEAVPESRPWTAPMTKMNAWNDNQEPTPALLRLGEQFGATLDALTDARNLREQIASQIKKDAAARAKAEQMLRDMGVPFSPDEEPAEVVKKLEDIVQGLAEEPAKPPIKP